MAFLESPRFPENLSYGAMCGPEFQTEVIVVNSGFESRNINWQQARARYDVGHRGRTRAETDALIAFFRAVKGKAHGFRFRDWTDYQVTHANGRLARLPGSAFQLQKIYPTGALTDARDIRKPVSVSLLRNRQPVVIGPAPGNASVDASTGIVRFVPDTSRAIASITRSNPGVVTTLTAHGFASGDLIDLHTPGGMGELDQKMVTISVLSATSFGIGIDTSVFTAYVGNGVASKTVQPSEVLSWQGAFDVPCRFDTDTMQIEVMDKGIYSWGQIPIVEIRT